MEKSTYPYYGLMVGVQQGQAERVRGIEGRLANDGDICALPANYPP